MRRGAKRQLAIVFGCMTFAAAGGPSAKADPPARYVDLATPFQKTVSETAGQTEVARIAMIRARIGALLGGIYPDGAGTDRRIASAVRQFPNDRPGYDRVVSAFPMALNGAIGWFRKVFPDFAAPLPIYLYHSLGQRDGGSDYLQPGKRHVMLFGADMIAKYHSDDSFEPFLIHEIFHLEHARHFPDCDQLWCTVWQEGLAVDATAAMIPHATDHQLLLDIPAPIRAPTEAHRIDALCFVANHFDDAASDATTSALSMGGHPPEGLPDRFGYYVGFRLAQATGLNITRLSRFDHTEAKAVARDALVKLMHDARVSCAVPPAASPTIP